VHIRGEGLHLAAVDRQRTPVHAALEAAFDPIFERAHFVLARDVRGEKAVHADQRQAELLRAALQVTRLA